MNEIESCPLPIYWSEDYDFQMRDGNSALEAASRFSACGSTIAHNTDDHTTAVLALQVFEELWNG